MVLLSPVSAAAFHECQEIALLKFPPAPVAAQAAVGRKAVAMTMSYRFIFFNIFSALLYPAKHMPDFILNFTFKHFFIHYDSPSSAFNFIIPRDYYQ